MWFYHCLSVHKLVRTQGGNIDVRNNRNNLTDFVNSYCGFYYFVCDNGGVIYLILFVIMVVVQMDKIIIAFTVFLGIILFLFVIGVMISLGYL